MELVLAICTIFGTIIAYLAFTHQVKGDKPEKIQFLKQKFFEVEGFHKSLLERIKSFTESKNCYNTEFSDGYSFKEIIKVLEIGYEKHFPQNIKNDVRNMNTNNGISVPNLEEMITFLIQQQESLVNIDSCFKFNHEKILE